LIQKRAYKVLSMLLKVCFNIFRFVLHIDCGTQQKLTSIFLMKCFNIFRFVLHIDCGTQQKFTSIFLMNVRLFQDDEFIEKNLDVLLELMILSLPCQFPSKRYRLEWLYHLIIYILKVSGAKWSCIS
jgi:hypothetical protein